MAKPPAKAQRRATSAAKPKAETAAKAKVAASEPPAPKPSTAPKSKAAAKVPTKKATAPPPKAKPASAATGVSKLAHNTADAISTLASDILEDRIIPTIDQIKSVAAHVLGRDKPTPPKPALKRTPKK